ncbi:cyclase family protein [Kordia sp. YSTF-M3]|uniref:Cyclase family protein n=1 Tax=Kordia aestuariivivens TaxID=2759037 RepID=A0ABR7Q3U4_9FLAO|nr:cyclase family protein [Kordia aestuariivivens]MBC8753187.1 cyclase family protein [Kordia aestuariivivens]
MICTIQRKTTKHQIDLSKPLDISIPLRASKDNVNAWYLDAPEISPMRTDEWVGSVKEGGDVNFNNIYFNPHSHGTHTECVGHITEEVYSINQQLTQFFFHAEVITVVPEKKDGDHVISKKQLQHVIGNKKREAIVIRTLPNFDEKKSKQYSHTNPPYIEEAGAVYLREKGIKHLLIDLPSVDKEKDDGDLLAHNAFWNTSGDIRMDATITEFIYVANSIKDGAYYLNIQIAPFENDASPSKPILYKIEK